MTTNCPNCGHSIDAEDTAAASNSLREFNLKIPEHHWPIFKMIFDQMNIKFGMMGLGEFANLLPSYGNQIPLDRSKFRFFSDTALAYTFLGMERGYRVSTRIEEGGSQDYHGNKRMKVFADLDHEDAEKTISLEISGGVLEDIAKEVCEYLEDASRRITPM